jgi:hypothetical protein
VVEVLGYMLTTPIGNIQHCWSRDHKWRVTIY